MKTEYRLKPAFFGKRLQFKSTFKILWLYKITVWRYVPTSYVANCFKEKDCPFLYFPFSTSHCFYCHWFNDDSLKDFLEKYKDIKTLFEELKQDKKEVYSFEYFK